MTLKKEDIYEFTEKYSKVCLENDSVDKELFAKYGVISQELSHRKL